jgi:2-polyprenyl-6-methoxyphenol hydroxylase-like FAD-dependent oxidoreductase
VKYLKNLNNMAVANGRVDGKSNGASNGTPNGTTTNPTPSHSPTLPIIISGGGCVGLFLALLLSSSRIPSKILVIEPCTPDPTATRAIAHQPHTLPILSRVPGLLPELLSIGYLSSGLCFRTSAGNGSKVIASKKFDNSGEGLKGKGQLILPQGKLQEVLLRRLAALGKEKVEVKLGYSVTAFTSHANSVGVTITSGKEKDETFEATYLIAADGAHSPIRKSLGIPLTGSTLDAQLIALDVHSTLFTQHEFYNANFIVDPQHYGHIGCFSREKELWRVSFGGALHLSQKEIEDGVDEKLKHMLPNSGLDGQGKKAYEILRIAPYKAQQRLADTMYTSRVCLVGDAAHLTNPYAGLGLASGLADASSLAEVLERVLTGEARDGEVLLGSWSEAQRKKFGEAVDGPSRMAYARVRSDVSSEEKIEEFAARDKMVGALRSGMAVRPMVLETSGAELEGW